MPQPDYLRSMVINELLKDYHALTPALKALRQGGLPTDEQEWQRSLATGWFNRVFALYASGLLSVADLQLVASPRAAQLWRDHVAPLDKAVREAAHGPDHEGYVNPVEQFWREYADGQLRVFQGE